MRGIRSYSWHHAIAAVNLHWQEAVMRVAPEVVPEAVLTKQ